MAASLPKWSPAESPRRQALSLYMPDPALRDCWLIDSSGLAIAFCGASIEVGVGRLAEVVLRIPLSDIAISLQSPPEEVIKRAHDRQVDRQGMLRGNLCSTKAEVGNVGSILHAYREGDVSFDKAVEEIKKLIDGVR